MNMQKRKEGLLFGSFVADALSLGGHWVYDVDKIAKEIHNLRDYHNPLSIYHPSKKAGDFTHYGDMSLFLLSFIREYDFSSNTFEQDISEKWGAFISKYDGYMDHASRESLKNYQQNIIPSGQDSVSDLSPSSRISPLAYRFAEDIESLKKYAIIQTKMTNNTQLSIDATVLIVDILNDIFNGLTPSISIQNRLKDDNIKDLHQYISKAVDNDKDDKEAINEFGPACTVDSALASALHFIIKYENNFEEAVLKNIACGGDSSSRGMFIGMILGAYLGIDAVASDLIDKMNNVHIIKNFK